MRTLEEAPSNVMLARPWALRPVGVRPSLTARCHHDNLLVVSHPLEALLDEVRLLWHASGRAAERLHGEEEVTLGMRAVLEFLSLNGPTPVPAIARSRQVSRQHVQALVNELEARYLVALEVNPAHRRSPFVRLTRGGETVIARMKGRERRFFGSLELGQTRAELERAAATLRDVRRALGGRP